MNMLYRFGALALCILISSQVFGQRIVDIPADPVNLPDLYVIISGDTTANGDRTDNNTIYRLANGGVYVYTDIIQNSVGWALQIEAMDLNNLDSKPVIVGLPNSSGSYRPFVRSEGNITFKNLWVVVGENGPLNNHLFGSLRITGTNVRGIFKDCILEKDRGGMIQVRGDGVKLYIDNCEIRNGGNRRVLQGNGRAIDLRETAADTVIMTNTVVYNLADRFIRSQGAVSPHNYIKIDHCTAFNVAGRHGFIQLGRVRTAEITNNLFISPIMLGTTPAFTDEQTQPDNGTHKVITVDTLYAETALTVSNNNIFWTQDVLDVWSSIDSVSAPGVLSQLVKDHLGADTVTAYFSEVLTLENVPQSILPYVQGLYANPTATDLFDIIVEDSTAAGGPIDSGNLFNFSTFSACYPDNSQSATASTTGGPIGAVTGCTFSTSIDAGALQALEVYPNPAQTELHVAFELERASAVSLSIHDLSGRQVARLPEAYLPAGAQRLTWQVPHILPRGLYLAQVRVGGQVQMLKIVLN